MDLKSLIKEHSASFEALLGLIPAEYSIRDADDDEDERPLTKSQKKALKRKNEEPEAVAAKRDAMRQAKLKRYDPDAPKSILEASVLEASMLDTDDAVEVETPVVEAKSAPRADAPTPAELRERLQRRIADIQAAKRNGALREDSPMSKEDLLDERRRKRGELRDNRRKRRKAERKSDAPPSASTSRAVGNMKKPNAGVGTSATPLTAATIQKHNSSLALPNGVTSNKPDVSTFTFSKLAFGTEEKKKQNKDPRAALEALERHRQKLEAMTPEERERVEDKERWQKLGQKAEGEKVRDDEKRLKKMAKRVERQKKKSKKAWAERSKATTQNMAAKQAKRKQNIEGRIQAKKDKKMGVSRKKTSSSKSSANKRKARPGFEGRKK